MRDEARAEDLVQDTLVAALEREQAGRVPGRAWLTAVLRNVARLRARSGARRAAHEAQRETGDAPAADEVAARIEAQRRLAEALLALAEPWRTTLALRFFEDLPPREVARRMGVPVRTVHSRTERALAELKARLDHSFGRRDAWCGALARLAGGGLALPLGLSTLGGLAMGTAIKWGGAAALLVAGGFLVQSRWSAPGRPAAPPARALAQAEEPAALAAPPLAQRAPGEEAPRTAVASAEPRRAAPAAAVSAAEVETFAGRVIDDRGRPVEGVLVVFESPADSLGQHLPQLVLRSPDGPLVEVELAREERPAELVLAVPEVRHVRIVLESDTELANLFSFEDAGGANLMTTSMTGSVRMSANMHVFLDGSSGLVATDERATTLVLFKGGTEVRRVPLELKRGSVAEIRL